MFHPVGNQTCEPHDLCNAVLVQNIGGDAAAQSRWFKSLISGQMCDTVCGRLIYLTDDWPNESKAVPYAN